MVTRDEFHSRMDAFSGRVYDQDYSTAKNRVRLDEHEKRIAALEAKRLDEHRQEGVEAAGRTRPEPVELEAARRRPRRGAAYRRARSGS